MLENKAQNSSGKQAVRSTKFHALSRVIKEGYSYRHISSDTVTTSPRSEKCVLGVSPSEAPFQDRQAFAARGNNRTLQH